MKSSQIKDILSNIREKDITNFQSNYFLNELDEEIQCLKNNNAIIFLQPDRDIYRLYFAFINLSDFEELLKELPTDIKISLEILTKKELNQDLYDCINKYLPYETTFVRSRCDIDKLRVFRKTQETDITYAELKDADFIENSLNTTFNHFSSHLPPREELEEHIKNKQVILTRKNGCIDSFILFKINQNNVNFDQWVSLSKDATNGMSIIDQFYNHIKISGYKQIYNWVDVDNNIDVQNFHKFYGYKPDGLKDIYFVNSALKKTVK